MLDLKHTRDMKKAFETTIDALGVPAVWTQASGGGTGNLTIGFRTAGADDNEIINAYGIGAKIVKMKASDFTPPVEPQKFDSIVINSERYTLDACMPIHLNGALIGFKAYVRGK